MARQLIIDRFDEGLFTHKLIIDGVESDAVDNSPNLTGFNLPNTPQFLDFKTDNGAPLLRKQRIEPSEITITDSFGGEPPQTGFTAVQQVFTSLKNLGYFARFSSEVEITQGLLINSPDVFPNTYLGQDNKVLVVNESENRMEFVYMYNYHLLSQQDDVSIPGGVETANLGQVLGVINVTDENDVVTKKVGMVDLPQNGVITPNGFTDLGTIEIDGNTVRALPVFQWDMTNIHYIQSVTYEETIAPAGTGNSRTDVIVTLPGQNTFQKIAGEVSPGSGTSAKPLIPVGTLELTTIQVYEDNIVDYTDPQLGNQFIKKETIGIITYGLDSENDGIPFDVNKGRTVYELTSSVNYNISGILNNSDDASEYAPMEGQIFHFICYEPKTFLNGASETNVIPFSLPDNTNLITSSRKIVSFIYASEQLIFQNYSELAGIMGLNEVLANNNTATNDITLISTSEVSARTLISGLVSGTSEIFKNTLPSGNINFIVYWSGVGQGGSTFGSGGNSNFTTRTDGGVPIMANSVVEYASGVSATQTGRQLVDANFVDNIYFKKTGGSVSGNILVDLARSVYFYTNDYGIGLRDQLGLQLYTADIIRFGQSQFGSIFTEKMRLALDTGNLMIGTTFVDDGNKLQVDGDIRLNGSLFLGKFTNGTEPAYALGKTYFNTSINKIKYGGASGWETLNPANSTRNLDVVVSATSVSYQNNELIGSTSISMIVMNGDIQQPPFVFNSTTGTISMTVTIGDILTIFYKKQ